MIKVIIVFLFLAVFGFFSHAENIVFKSGKIISAPIVEQSADSIKVDIEGVVLRYYFNEIESIDGNLLSFNSDEITTSELEVSNDNEVDSGLWSKWFDESGAREYIGQTRQIDHVFKKRFLTISDMLMSVSENEDPDMVSEVIDRIREKHNPVFKKIKNLSPPEDFLKYNEILNKVCETITLAEEALLKADPGAVKAYQRQALLLIVASLKELRNIYLEHSAPSDILNGLDSVIVYYNNLLGKMS